MGRPSRGVTQLQTEGIVALHCEILKGHERD